MMKKTTMITLLALATVALGLLPVAKAVDKPEPAHAFEVTVWGDTRAGVDQQGAEPRFTYLVDNLEHLGYDGSLAVGDFVNVSQNDTHTSTWLDTLYDNWISAARHSGAGIVQPTWPTYFTPGNHEDLIDAAEHARYHAKFSPTNNPVATTQANDDLGGGPQDYYEFTLGDTSTTNHAHFLMVSTASDTRLGYIGYISETDSQNSAQAKWLVRRLQAIHAGEGDNNWIIVCTHYPLFDPKSSDPYGGGGTPDCTAERNGLASLFDKYGVDVVFQGHVHNYRDHHETGKPYYITQGMGGAAPKPYNEQGTPDAYDAVAFGADGGLGGDGNIYVGFSDLALLDNDSNPATLPILRFHSYVYDYGPTQDNTLIQIDGMASMSENAAQ